MKKRNLILILLAVVLLIGCTTVFIFGEGLHISREQFFSSVIKILDLPEADDSVIKFVDADQIGDEYRGNIAKGVKAGLIYGKNDGTIDPKTEITIAEVDWFLSRIDLTPKTIIKHVSGGTRVIEKEVIKEVEKRVEVPAELICDLENNVHYFEFDDTNGSYKCLCGEIVNPVGTVQMRMAADVPESPEGYESWILDEEITFDKTHATVTGGKEMDVAFNGSFFVKLETGELEPIGFAEILDTYNAVITYDEDGFETSIDPLCSVYYHIDERAEGDRPLIDAMVIVGAEEWVAEELE